MMLKQDNSKIIEINYKKFSTENKDFLTWINHLYNKINLPTPFPSLIFSSIPFFLGLVLSLINNFSKVYLQTSVIYVGVFVPTYVLEVIRLGHKNIHIAYEELRPCFIISDEKYKNILTKWLKEITNFKKECQGILICFLICSAIAYSSFYQYPYLKDIGITSLRPHIVDSSWFNLEYKNTNFAIIILFAFFISFPLATAARHLILNILFLCKEIQKLPVIPIPNIIRLRLTKLSNLFLSTSLFWYIAVFIMGYIFFYQWDLLTYSVIGFLAFLGFVLFLIPQLVYRKLIKSSSFLSSQWVIESFYKMFEISITEKNVVDSILNNKLSTNLTNDIKSISDYLEISSKVSFWVYDTTQIFMGFGGLFFSMLSVMFEKIFENFQI